jgi:hypothetical protein
MAEDIGHWIGALPEWLQVIAIPLFIVGALLFVPIGGGDTLGTMILEFMARKAGMSNDKK